MLNLYETYYKLSADPFRLSPDHHFAFGHQGYANAKAYLEYAFFQGEGFVMVTGDPGTGKTTLINEIIAGLDHSQMQVATLTTTQLDTRDLLHMVAVLFGMRVSEVSKPALLMDLKQYLSEQADRGWRSILVVDEAQGLSAKGLEELRLLANLQHRDRLLIQICLIGQDQLRDLVQTPEMEHLRQRIIAASHLTPLTLEETVDYIEHRLSHAGWKGRPSISEGALRQIHHHSGGIPRLVNLICNRLFLYGGLESRQAFDTADACQVIGELQQEQLLKTEPVSASPSPADSREDATELSLPRAGSEPAVEESAEKHSHWDILADEDSDKLPRMESGHDDDWEEAPAGRVRKEQKSASELRAELGEPYITTSRLDTLSPDASVYETAESELEMETQDVGRSRRVMAIMVLLIGILLVVVLGSDAGKPIAEQFKTQWYKLVAPAGELPTAVDSTSTPVIESDTRMPEPVTPELETAPQLAESPETTLPFDHSEPEPVDSTIIETIPEEPLPVAVDRQEFGAEPSPTAVEEQTAETTPAEPPEADLSMAIAEEKRRLEDEARQTFERRVVEQVPVPQPVEQESTDRVKPPLEEGDVKQASAIPLSSLEAKPVVAEQEPLFNNLKDIHRALLGGRWSEHGKPAVFLPSEITFCSQRNAHAQITCWSVPQYIEKGQAMILQKVEATLQSFSSHGDFELIYRSMRAPAEADDDRLLWQTSEHRLWCEFSEVDRLVCVEPETDKTVELRRSSLTNKNSVRINEQEYASG